MAQAHITIEVDVTYKMRWEALKSAIERIAAQQQTAANLTRYNNSKKKFKAEVSAMNVILEQMARIEKMESVDEAGKITGEEPESAQSIAHNTGSQP